MAGAGKLKRDRGAADFAAPARDRALLVWLVRAAILAVLLGAWQAVAVSGWLFRDVVPTLPVIGRAIVRLLSDRGFYANLQVTAGEIAAALAIGGSAGMAVRSGGRRVGKEGQ
jgi:ABC-type nitrate/sulfonate/bicarbonate transport system permease component